MGAAGGSGQDIQRIPFQVIKYRYDLQVGLGFDLCLAHGRHFAGDIEPHDGRCWFPARQKIVADTRRTFVARADAARSNPMGNPTQVIPGRLHTLDRSRKVNRHRYLDVRLIGKRAGCHERESGARRLVILSWNGDSVTRNRVLRQKPVKKRILLNDDQRRRSAVKGKILGRKMLEQLAASLLQIRSCVGIGSLLRGIGTSAGGGRT